MLNVPLMVTGAHPSLERRFLVCKRPAPTSSAHSSMMSPSEVHDLLVAHGIQRAQPHGRPAHMRMRRWIPTDGITTALHSVVPFDREWFSSSLTVSSICTTYASRNQHDARFGALVDAFKFQWTGSGLLNPPTSCADKALRWALQSTTTPYPVLHVALVAMLPKMTALLKRHQDNGRMHVLCRIKAQASQAGLQNAGSIPNPRLITMDDSLASSSFLTMQAYPC